MDEIVAGLPRFYAPDLDASASTSGLPADEQHHLTRVMRLGPGARVLLFDGRGVQVVAEVETAGRHDVRLRVLQRAAAAREPDVDIVVVQAVLKGDKMDAVVRDATMMGVLAVQPVVTTRTVVPARAVDTERSAAISRWQRVAISSAKQCGRAVVPTIRPPMRLDAALAGHDAACRLVLAEPNAAAADGDGPPAQRPRAAALLVGPEGGWTPEEMRAARAAGWTPWSLGRMTLRADAAALAALGALSHVWR